MKKIAQITNADCYLDGEKQVGLVSEFNMEGLEYEAITHEALGMIAKIELPSRTLSPMNATIKFAWVDADVLARTALPNKAMTFQLHAMVDVFDAGGIVPEEGYRMITTISVLFKTSTIDSFKNGDATGIDLACTVLRFESKSSKSDTLIREIDVFNHINRANGKDVWPTY